MIARKLHVLTAEGGSAIWRVEYDRAERDIEEPWRLSLIAPAGARYDVTGLDLFFCLKQIRQQTDREGILLCCNGARKNARPSGFLGSSIGAMSINKIHRWRAFLPVDLVDIFDYASPRTIATVEEQEAYWQQVDRYRKSVLIVLNPIQWITYGYRQLYDWLREVQLRRLEAKADRSRDAQP